MKIETGKTNQAHSRDLIHSINNVNEKMTSNKPLIADVPSIQVQSTDPNQNQLDMMCQISKVHKVHQA